MVHALRYQRNIQDHVYKYNCGLPIQAILQGSTSSDGNFVSMTNIYSPLKISRAGRNSVTSVTRATVVSTCNSDTRFCILLRFLFHFTIVNIFIKYFRNYILQMWSGTMQITKFQWLFGVPCGQSCIFFIPFYDLITHEVDSNSIKLD